MRALPLALLCAACAHPTAAPLGPQVAASSVNAELVVRLPLPEGLPPGLSGLDVDEAGLLWLVAERDPGLWLIRIEGDQALLVGERAVSEQPAGLDTESLGISSEMVVLGTEAPRTREEDYLLVAPMTQSGPLRIQRRIELPYAPFGLKATPNHGVEAVCVASDAILAVGEPVDGGKGLRRAPLWMLPLDGGVTTTGWLPLTSDSGRISGLDCTGNASHGYRVLAIERYYSVARLVRTVVSAVGVAELVAVLDLAPLISLDPTLNLEGVASLPDGRIALVNDNQSVTLVSGSAIYLLPAGLMAP